MQKKGTGEMADNFARTLKTDKELIALLEKAAKHVLTPREIWQQRVSFVYGQLFFKNPTLTKEDIERKATEIYGPCPPATTATELAKEQLSTLRKTVKRRQ